MNATLHYDYQAPLESELLDIAAGGLMVGDTIVADGSIPLRVTEVRSKVAGFITAGYSCTAGSGFRTFAAGQMVTVLRTSIIGAH